jgi:hypothetical protein
MTTYKIKVFDDMGHLVWEPFSLPFDITKYINQDVETYYRYPDHICSYTTRHYKMMPNVNKKRHVVFGGKAYLIEYCI